MKQCYYEMTVVLVGQSGGTTEQFLSFKTCIYYQKEGLPLLLPELFVSLGFRIFHIYRIFVKKKTTQQERTVRDLDIKAL